MDKKYLWSKQPGFLFQILICPALSSFILSHLKCTAEKYDTTCVFRTPTLSAITVSAMGWFQTGVQWKDCTNMPKGMDTNVHWWLLLLIISRVMGFLDVMLHLRPSISRLSCETPEHYTHLQIVLQLSLKKKQLPNSMELQNPWNATVIARLFGQNQNMLKSYLKGKHPICLSLPYRI